MTATTLKIISSKCYLVHEKGHWDANLCLEWENHFHSLKSPRTRFLMIKSSSSRSKHQNTLGFFVNQNTQKNNKNKKQQLNRMNLHKHNGKMKKGAYIVSCMPMLLLAAIIMTTNRMMWEMRGKKELISSKALFVFVLSSMSS